jgi:hypothetical protein
MQDTSATALYGTNSCRWCGDIGEVEVPYAGLLAYHKGALIQDAFPDLDKTLREQIISGTHPECWGEMYGG